jgi:Domain of unknown function (DUF4440)
VTCRWLCAAGAGRQRAPAASIGRFWAAPQRHRFRPHVMLMRLTLPLVLAVSSLHSGPVAAQAVEPATHAVLRAEDERFGAMVRGDTTALRSLLADSLTYTHTDGAQQSKVEFLHSIATGDLRYQSIEPEGRVVRLRGDVGVVTGRSAMRVAVGAEVHAFMIQYIAVYEHRGGQWQLLAWQSTRLP